MRPGARHTGGVVTRPPSASIPDSPGSYQFVDKNGRVLYVGKAKSLRQRLNSYFQDPHGLAPRTAQMVAQADHVEWMVVDSESEALLLEYSLIKQYQPRFNVRLKDDKSYPWLALTVNEEWPRPAVVRGRKRAGVRYFGPYANVGAIRGTLDLLLRSFPVRTCTDTKFTRHQRLGRPCLLYHIERCSGPCIGAVDHDDYDRMVADLISFLSGDTGPLVRGLEVAMHEASQDLEFERASVLRDKLEAVRAADAVRQMELDRPEDLDVFGLAEDELEAAVQVFHVRSGRVVGRLALFVDKVEDLTPGQLMERILVDVYADAAAGVPRQVLVPTLPADPAAVTQYLTERRGGPVALKVPLRGPKRALVETVEHNAGDAFMRHRLHRTSDHNSRARALESLQRELGLPDAPLRIECYDMSHLQGTDYVGSMVVFEDALPKKSDYRHFRVDTVPGTTTTRPWRRCSPVGSPHCWPRRDRRRPTGGSRGRPAAPPAEGRHGGGSPTHPSCCSWTAASDSSTWGCGCSSRWGCPNASRSPPWPRASRRSTGRGARSRSGSPASPRASTCSSAFVTRPIASPSRTTGPCAASG
jgi:excinuclease ABC subunit C